MLEGKVRLTCFMLALAALVVLPAGPARSRSSTVAPMGMVDHNMKVKVGAAAPPFSGQDLEGKTLSSDVLKGRPILVDFSSIFCGSCQEDIKEFKRLKKDYKDTDLALIIVADGEAPFPATKNFFKEAGADYAVLWDADEKIYDAFGITVIPFQVVIDRKGVIVKMHVGSDPDLEKLLGLKDLVRK